MTRHPLPTRLTTTAARPLAKTLLENVETRMPLSLDGSAVDLVGQACLQVLASAQKAAVARKLDFAIHDPSDALREGCALAGLDHLLAPAA